MKLVIDSIEIPVKIIRSRRNSIRMSYKKGSHAILNIPQYLGEKAFQEAWDKLKEWLIQLYEKEPATFTPPERSVKDGQELTIMGTSFTIHFLKGNRENIFNAKKKDDQIYIEIPEKYVGDERAMSKVFPKIVNKLFLKSITQRVAEINAATLKVKVNKVSLRHNTSKWGSCSHTNNISLSTNLLLAPEHIINHVILHELAHVVHKDHSADFWNLVARHDKNWRENDAWLNRHGHNLNY